ncbi:DNA polymerase III subunit delta [bacterium]|jgi:DNA polymerase III delta subunit|nr:DNA polymerase III subunit delta [bacterium]MBT6831944.1 DNA polymerase III subunit delta [bacterium]MBT6996640.1 DNA polymerase III subunit delta [bacterium]MBT7773060.1 DNA polymerase III subunit delta [bacterium]
MIQNLFLLTGEDDFRLRERARILRDGFGKKYPDGDLEIFETKSELRNLENLVLTPNLFGGRRLAVCDEFWNAEKFEAAEKSKFFERLPGFSETATVIALEPKLDKRTKWAKFLLAHARVENFDQLDESQLLRWIEQRTERLGGEISRSCAKFLLNRCGPNLWTLSGELGKIVMCAGEEKIDEKLITELSRPRPQLEIWDFLENVSRQNAIGAVEKFRSLLVLGQPVQMIFSMLQREIRIHAQLRAGLNQHLSAPEIAKITKLHPFVVQKTLNLSKNFSAKKIRKMYDELFEIEKRMKSGGIITSVNDAGELELAIEKFIVNLCA